MWRAEMESLRPPRAVVNGGDRRLMRRRRVGSMIYFCGVGVFGEGGE